MPDNKKWSLPSFFQKNLKTSTLLLFAINCCAVNAQQSARTKTTTQNAQVIWTSPSKNALGSMPAGNGDVGINLWVEQNGNLLFYLSKTDAWSENARLLKVGKVRLALSPNPFQNGVPFKQELDASNGMIRIEAGEKENKVLINVWVDAHHPLVQIDVTSKKNLQAKVSTEPWRTNRRKLDNKTELHSAYGLHGIGAPDVFVEKDSILNAAGEEVIWLHRNERSIWQDNLKLQGLEEYVKNNEDPLLHRTFGGLLKATGFKKIDHAVMETKKPLQRFSVSVYTITAQTSTMKEWVDQIKELAATVEAKSAQSRLANHQQWWRDFWNRTYIAVSTSDISQKEKVQNVNKGYALQRYMNACAGRGGSPIKFNGSIFTVDTKDLPGEFIGFDADYRRWGGPYWWQNTRLPYWSMLEAGDFDLMPALFDRYKKAIPIRKLATQKYYGHKGVFFPETMYFWGTYVDGNYGRNRTGLALGETENKFIRYYWQSGLELSLMMLDYYAFTKDQVFLKETLLPVATEIIDFFDAHWKRDKEGKIRFEPAMALETYQVAVNPLPEIVGIQKVCTELLRLSGTVVSEQQKINWKKLIGELPEIPTREYNGKKILAPAHEYGTKQNTENPELYAIFPYRMFGMGKDSLQMARETFNSRSFKGTGGWYQNAIKAACLGLTDEAAELTMTNFNTSNNAYRFPAMWGPNFDWTPDQDHGSVAMVSLQRMLLQYDGEKIWLLPAWPKYWDVEFKLHAPGNTVITGTVKAGKLTRLKVVPEIRSGDVIIAETYKAGSF